MQHKVYQQCSSCVARSLKKEAKQKEKKSKVWKQRQGEQKQAQAKKQKKYDGFHPILVLGLPAGKGHALSLYECFLHLQHSSCRCQAANATKDPIQPA